MARVLLIFFLERFVLLMKLPKKRYLLPLLGLASLLAFILTIAILLPRVLPLDSVKHDIESRVSTIAGGKITYAAARLEYAPWPQLIFRETAIEIPGKISGAIESLVVIPKLLPLLTGTIEIGKLNATRPVFRMELPAAAPGSPTEPVSLRESAGSLAALISGIGNAVKEKLVIQLASGQIELVQDTHPIFRYQHVTGDLLISPDRVTMKITGRSEEDEDITAGFNFDPAHLSGRGHLALKRFLPQKVHSLFFPHSDIQLGESRLDLSFDLIVENPEKFSGTLSGVAPLLTLYREKEAHPFREGNFNAAFVIEKDRTELSISELRIAYPALNLTGSFLSDPSTSHYQWEIGATDLNLSQAGKSARVIAGHVPLVQTLCTVLKDGWVRNLELKDSASSLSDLRKIGNLSIQGFLENGTVYIPAPDLTLTEATGWVDMRNGILEGKDLRAQLGKAKGHGTYRMEFSGEKIPFFLDTMVEADLSELPPLLHQLIENKIFKQEMTRIAEAKGSAEGRLIIDHTALRTAVTVDVSRLNLSGRYDRIPYPVTVTEGEFHYDAERIRVNKLRGHIGTSTFSGLNATVGTASPFELDIMTGRTGADMGQVHPWLNQYDTLAPYLKSYESVTGLISAKSISLKGPALHPQAWQFSLEGNVKDLRVVTPAFPSPVIFHAGSFTAGPEIIVFDRTAFETMGTKLEAQGRYTGYLKNEPSLETSLMGSLEADAAAWVRKTAGIPRELAWQSPIILEPIRISLNHQGDLSVSGAVQKPAGPAVELSLHRTPQCLTVDHLSFRDDDSDSSFSIQSENDGMDIKFIGKLDEKTLNAFFSGTPFLSGQIEGDFNARLLRSKPFLSAAKGHLYIGQLDFSKFNWPLTVHQASLAGTGNSLKISSTHLTWQGNSFLLDGEVNRFEDRLNLDLTTAVEKIDWRQLSSLIEKKTGPPEEAAVPLWRRFPISGNITVHADNFICSEKLAFRPFEGRITFAGDQLTVSVSQAKLCGLSLTGVVTHSPDHYHLDATPAATNEDLGTSLACVWGNSKIIDGRFQLDGHLSGTGNKETPLRNALSGDLAFLATQGRIHRFGFFAKIFTLLNVAGLLKGEVPELEKEGFPYKTARAIATLENGKLKIQEGEIDSSAMRIFFSGEENLSAKTHDLTIVVAPLSTVDMLVRHIPLVRSVLNKGVVIYPITATGTWENPQLNLLAPTAVGEQIWGIVLRTLKLPLTILTPVISGEKPPPRPHNPLWMKNMIKVSSRPPAGQNAQRICHSSAPHPWENNRPEAHGSSDDSEGNRSTSPCGRTFCRCSCNWTSSFVDHTPFSPPLFS
jgi:hypothetical protein